MDNRVATYLNLLTKGINNTDAVTISKLDTMTKEELTTECDNMINLLENSIRNLTNVKNELLMR